MKEDVASMIAWIIQVPSVLVASILAVSTVLFSVAVAMEKFAADDLTKLPTGEGVLATRVRNRLHDEIARRRNRSLRRFAVWTVLGSLAGVALTWAIKAAPPFFSNLLVLSASFLVFSLSLLATYSWVRTNRIVQKSRDTLRKEIESATWVRRDRELIAKSLAVLADTHAS